MRARIVSPGTALSLPQVGAATAVLGGPASILVALSLLSGLGGVLLFGGFLRRHIDLVWLRGPTLKLAYRLAKTAADFRQLFPPENHERDDQDDDQFLQTKPKHVHPSSSSLAHCTFVGSVRRLLL